MLPSDDRIVYCHLAEELGLAICEYVLGKGKGR